MILPFLAFVGFANSDLIKFSTDQRGLFAHEVASPPKGSNAAQSILGLINKSYPTDSEFDPKKSKQQWERFIHFAQDLNKTARAEVKYKVLYLARHGEAYHNIAEKHYGTDCWNCYWSMKNGNQSLSWIDAELTVGGLRDAGRSNLFWQQTAPKSKVPFPEILFTSPLMRCLEMVNNTFGDNKQLKTSRGVFVKEGLRASVSACTCNWRHDKRWLNLKYPHFSYDIEMPLQDPFWIPGMTESASSQRMRVKEFMDSLHEINEFAVYVMTHGSVIKDILTIIDHPNPNYSVATGQMIPVLLRTEKMKGKEPKAKAAPSRPVPQCDICGVVNGTEKAP